MNSILIAFLGVRHHPQRGLKSRHHPFFGLVVGRLPCDLFTSTHVLHACIRFADLFKHDEFLSLQCDARHHCQVGGDKHVFPCGYHVTMEISPVFDALELLPLVEHAPAEGAEPVEYNATGLSAHVLFCDRRHDVNELLGWVRAERR